jgi:hypothetical protein
MGMDARVERCHSFISALWEDGRAADDELLSMTVDGVMLGVGATHEQLTLSVYGELPFHARRALLDALPPARLPTYAELRRHLEDVVALPADPGTVEVG